MKKYLLHIILPVIFFICTLTTSAQNLGIATIGSTSYPTAKVITASGATISTAQSKFGGASARITKTSGQSLNIPDSPDWYFGTGNFTIDFWIRLNTLSTGEQIVQQNAGTGNSWGLFLYPSGGTKYWIFQENVGGTLTIDIRGTSPGVVAGIWYHVALVRNGSTWYVFQNGVSCTISTNTGASLAVNDFSAPLGIYASEDGWLDELRISKGTARWTANFTPPTVRYDRDGSTVLLLHNDGTDGSTTFLDDVTTGEAKATRVSLPDNNATFNSMSFYSHAAGNARLAIYNDAAGVPSAKQWESGDVAVGANAWTNVNISNGTPASLTLNSGTYWLAWEWNPGAAYTAGPSYKDNTGNGNYLYRSYTAFPSPWSGGVASSEEWSIYASYCAAPTISTQPTSQTACTGGTATFSVAAAGTGLTYQWRKGTNNINGATSASYTINPVATGDAATNYNVVITGTCGTVTSNNVTLTVNEALSITTQPVNQAACVGTSATFSVTAGGTGLTYQWRKGTNNINGAISSSYTISSVASGDAAVNYNVLLTGSCGTLASSNATLTVNPTPVASATKTDISCFNASNGTITVSGSGGSGSYTGYSITNGLPLPVPNGYQASATFNGLGPGQYQIRVIDNNGCESKSVQ